jgi:lactose/L-arabinose transport system permease protein
MRNGRLVRSSGIAGWMDRRAGFILCLPALVVMLGFMLYPLLYAIQMSFLNWKPRSSRWIGLSNYIRLFKDPLFWKVMLNTLFYTSINLTVGMAVSLFLALVMDVRSFFTTAFRTMVFLPMVISMSVTSMIWVWILDPGFGLLNQTLCSLGIIGNDPVLWLNSTEFSKWSIVMVNIWKGSGMSALLLLAGLQNIPRELYEAATIEGAGYFKKLFSITLPLLKNIILVVLVIKSIGSFNTFDQVFIMTGGGPLYSSETILAYLYRNGFEYFDFGYASAIGVIFFLIVMALSGIQMFCFRDKEGGGRHA